MSRLQLADIQGIVLRAYAETHARHLALAFTSAAGAAALLSGLGGGARRLRITSAAPPRGAAPAAKLNLGLTAAGLRVLGVSEAIMQAFPAAFLDGPAQKGAALGDDGASDPKLWAMGGPDTPVVHAVISLFAAGSAALERADDELCRHLLVPHGVSVLSRHAAEALPDGRIHFGYRDGISQPRIRGLEQVEPWIPDLQPDCEPGEFLLGQGYVNQFGGNFLEDLPAELGGNGSYGAFRIMAQDVFGFAHYVNLVKERFRMGTPGSGQHPDMVAAKLMGRWPNGDSLVVSPQCPREPPPEHELNRFDYAPSAAHPAYFDDDRGLRCPLGSHVRRMNPRSALVMGKPHTRRIIRRNLPYGPAVAAGAEPDAIERGLIGYFVCGDLELQFEFLLKIWANMDIATAGIRGTRDPIIGAQDWLGAECPTGAHGDWAGQYVIRTDDLRDPIVLDDLPRFVRTRGSVYCLLPSVSAIGFLARAGAGAQ